MRYSNKIDSNKDHNSSFEFGFDNKQVQESRQLE
jgi:hypothetical protein